MNQVIRIFPVNLREKIEQDFRTIGQVEENRIRIGQPFTFWDGKKEYYPEYDSLVRICRESGISYQEAYHVAVEACLKM